MVFTTGAYNVCLDKTTDRILQSNYTYSIQKLSFKRLLLTFCLVMATFDFDFAGKKINSPYLSQMVLAVKLFWYYLPNAF